MQVLYCRAGVVVAMHDDTQNIPASAYGANIYAVPVESLAGLVKIGDPPPVGQPDGRAYAAPAATPLTVAAYANWKQWALATGGYTATVAGTPRTFSTDPDSLGLITGKAVRFGQVSPPTSVDWQFGSQFVNIASSDFTTAAIAVADFVQATFDALKTVLLGIAGGTIVDFAGVDAADWPTNHQ